MSQLVVCRNINGVVLAVDSKALDFTHPQKVAEAEVPRLLQLDKRTAVLTGGAMEGYRMCTKLYNLAILGSCMRKWAMRIRFILPFSKLYRTQLVMMLTSPFFMVIPAEAGMSLMQWNSV